MYSELGEKVKNLRIRRKVKQVELAKILNLSRAQISNLESGRRTFSISQLEKICNYFKVDMSYFVMVETPDNCLDLLDKAKILFDSSELTSEQKDDLFVSIMKMYLYSKN